MCLTRSQVEPAARLWAGDVTRALTDREALAPDRVVDLRYEDLVADPWSVVSDVARSVGLPITDAFRRSCETFARNSDFARLARASSNERCSSSALRSFSRRRCVRS